jgi:hypothetical protein
VVIALDGFGLNRRRLAGVALALVLFLVVAASAYAASVVWFDGFLSGNTINRAPDRHSLTQVSARKLDSTDQAVCVNALNDSNNQLAGEWRCVAG